MRKHLALLIVTSPCLASLLPPPPPAIISTPHLAPPRHPSPPHSPTPVLSIAVIPSSLSSQMRWSGPGLAIPFPANLCLPHPTPRPDCLICTLHEPERLDGWYFPRHSWPSPGCSATLNTSLSGPVTVETGGIRARAQLMESLEIIMTRSPRWLAGWLAVWHAP